MSCFIAEPPLRLIDDQERDVGDRYYKTGSTIDLYCQVSRSFLYKEKQNILKSLKPLNIHNDRNTTTNSDNSSNSVTATTGSSSFFGTNNKSSIMGSENTLNAGNSNSSDSDQMKITANNNNNNNQKASYDSNINGIFALAATSSTIFGVLNNDLLQNIKQSTTSVDKQPIGLEKQFSNLVFWSKNDATLPSTASKRSRYVVTTLLSCIEALVLYILPSCSLVIKLNENTIIIKLLHGDTLYF